MSASPAGGVVDIELYRYLDNGATGTVAKVQEINTTNNNLGSSSISNFTLFDGKLFFTAAADYTDGRLYSVNSSNAVTVEYNPPLSSNSNTPGNLVIIDDTLYFQSPNTTTQRELMRYNSTGNVTVLTAFNSNDYPRGLVGYAGDLYFLRNAGNGLELQRYDIDTQTVTELSNLNTNGDSFGSTAPVVMPVALAPAVYQGATGQYYTVGGSAVIVNSDVAVSDVDGSAIVSGTVVISSGLIAGDQLAFTDQAGIVGSYNSARGLLTLTGSATITTYQSALRTIAFSTTNTTVGDRVIRFQLSDGSQLSSATARSAQSTVRVVDKTPTVVDFETLPTGLAAESTSPDPLAGSFNLTAGAFGQIDFVATNSALDTAFDLLSATSGAGLGLVWNDAQYAGLNSLHVVTDYTDPTYLALRANNGNEFDFDSITYYDDGFYGGYIYFGYIAIYGFKDGSQVASKIYAVHTQSPQKLLVGSEFNDVDEVRLRVYDPYDPTFDYTPTAGLFDDITLLPAPVTAVAPTVGTPTSTDVDTNTATLGGTVADTGGGNITERGIYWSTTDGFTPPGQGSKVADTGDWGTDAFTINVSALPADTPIYFQAFATNSAGTAFSAQGTFTTTAGIIESTQPYTSITGKNGTLHAVGGYLSTITVSNSPSGLPRGVKMPLGQLRFTITGTTPGACSGTAACVVTMTASSAVTANFAALPFTLNSHLPITNSVSVPLTSSVVLTYSTDLDAATVTSRTIAVHSMYHGLVTATHSVANNVATITPSQPFFPGELVYTSATTRTADITGTQSLTPTVWQFNAVAPSGYGHLTAPVDFGTGSEDTRSLAWGDFDGDGDLDLAVGNNGQNVLYLNNGDGTFGTGITFGTGSDNTYALAWGDFDGDGDLDLAVGNESAQNVLYPNNGDGSFGTGINFGTGGDYTFSVAWGDFDGDGDLDLATGNVGQNVVYFNNGAGSFNSGINVGASSGTTRSIAWGDFDNDGDLDLASSNDGTQNVLYLNGPLILTVNKSGNGSVTSIPAGIDCGITCTADIACGTVVTLTATADSGSIFNGWTGVCSGTGSCTVAMTQTQAVTATFELACPTGVAYVDRNASGADTGQAWADAHTDLAQALQQYSTCGGTFDEIWVARGVYTPGITVSDTFTIPAGVALYGGFASTETVRTERDWTANVTVLSGDIGGDDMTDANGILTNTAHISGTNAYQVALMVSISTTALITEATRLDGFTITGGSATGLGYNRYGGGLFCHAYAADSVCSPTLANVTFTGNTASVGA